MSALPPTVWESYPEEGRNRYIQAIMAFSSLTPLFKQKRNPDDPNETLTPYILSKYQEVAFAEFLQGKVVDIGNTPYDIQLRNPLSNNQDFLGIKTFLNSSNKFQKVMQLKSDAVAQSWEEMIRDARYIQFVEEISKLRNQRLDSSLNALLGVSFGGKRDEVGSTVYHYLSPADDQTVYIGETQYSKMDLERLSFTGVRKNKNGEVTSLDFTDQQKKYRYTPADSTLYMSFEHRKSKENGGDIIDKFKVKYLDNPYKAMFSLLELEHNPIEPITVKKVEKPAKENCVVFPLVLMEDDPVHDYKRGEIPTGAGINAALGTGRNGGTRPRPDNEIEIIIRKPLRFHRTYQGFFGFSINSAKEAQSLSPESRSFDMYFGNASTPFPCSVGGSGLKNIRSNKNLAIIGKWIREDVMRISPRTVVTPEILKEVGYDGYRLTKIGHKKIRFEVIKITTEDLPYLWPPTPELLTDLIDIPDID